MTTLPALSTPCTWNTFLARSTPMVLTCIWTTPSGDSLFNNHPMAHSMPGAGVVHHIKGGGRGRFARCRLIPHSGGITDNAHPRGFGPFLDSCAAANCVRSDAPI